MFIKVVRTPWATAILVAAPLLAAYLILAPSAGDLAAATYRSDLFARVGFTTWDTGWYAAHGHWLPAYSLLSPGAWSAAGRALAAGPISSRRLRPVRADRRARLRHRRGAPRRRWFALGFCVGLLSGRVPYDLGFAIGLGAMLALIDGRGPGARLAVLTSAASPVAGAFLALAAVARGLGCVPMGPCARARPGDENWR